MILFLYTRGGRSLLATQIKVGSESALDRWHDSACMTRDRWNPRGWNFWPTLLMGPSPRPKVGHPFSWVLHKGQPLYIHTCQKRNDNNNSSIPLTYHRTDVGKKESLGIPLHVPRYASCTLKSEQQKKLLSWLVCSVVLCRPHSSPSYTRIRIGYKDS